jgi:hypothetical protein
MVQVKEWNVIGVIQGDRILYFRNRFNTFIV